MRQAAKARGPTLMNYFTTVGGQEGELPVQGHLNPRLWKGDFAQLRLRLYVILLACDAAMMAVSFLVANKLRFGALTVSFGLNTFMLLFPIYVAVAFNAGAWSVAALSSPRRSAFEATKSLVVAIAVSTIVLFSLKVGASFSRLVFGIGAVLSLGALAGGRLLVGRAIGERCGWSFRKELLLLDGAEASVTGNEVVYDAKRLDIRPTTDDPLMLDRLARLLDKCERVVVACAPERRQAWAKMLAGANADVEVLAPELDSIGAFGLRRHGSQTALLVGCGPLRLRHRAVKRLFDLGVSGAAIVLLAPLLVIIALAIRLDSPGPILFRQPRMGRGNRLFSIFKFRTMRSEATDASGERSAARADDRVTRIGHVLRRTSLDELPQLLNVLRGEMSIVGPRPHPLGCRAENQHFWNIDERYFDRHAIKPGITGLAQVRGFRGATSKRSDVTERLGADREYIDGWHIGRDIAILVRTIGVLAHPNAF